ncbi:MAG TPA: rhamnan synthesis F family protein [Puia sp.]|jgi:lipopolysaccharide biosynthesis protein|nr:rhamnan synthesis F family protein [Puia sp.]
MPPFEYAILYHNFYDLAGIADIRGRIAALRDRRIMLLCSLPEKFAACAPHQQDDEKFVIMRNIGKDIGGKLILIHLLLTLYSEIPYCIFLHDKRSYQKQSGQFEKDGLYKILEPPAFRRIAEAFRTDPHLGIACAKGFLKNEYLGNGRFATPNSQLLGVLTAKYNIHPPGFGFVAGTMFWIRTSLLRGFFRDGLAPEVRTTLETGNVLDHEHGTVTHCWERLLSWIATSAGFKIKEFSC